MFIPKPAMLPEGGFVQLETFMAEYEGLDEPVVGGVAIYGSAAAYGLVWEYGSSRMQKPGPKTLWSTNPLGERAILTKQAPLGYIAIHDDEMWSILKDELNKVDFHSKTADGIRLEIEIAVDNASQHIARLISDSAPVDSGDLRSQIQFVDSEDLSK